MRPPPAPTPLHLRLQAAGDKEQVARDAAGALEAVSRQLAELKKARDEVGWVGVRVGLGGRV
jgi:hypothetical protein